MDFGLWELAGELKARVLAGMTPASKQYWEEENSYFNKVRAWGWQYMWGLPVSSPLLAGKVTFPQA